MVFLVVMGVLILSRPPFARVVIYLTRVTRGDCRALPARSAAGRIFSARAERRGGKQRTLAHNRAGDMRSGSHQRLHGFGLGSARSPDDSSHKGSPISRSEAAAAHTAEVIIIA